MATYNTLTVLMNCPRCGRAAETEVECFFGDTSQMREYRAGEAYDWVAKKFVQSGGRPVRGDLDGEGYAQCPLCGKDYHVKVIVRGGVIRSAQPDLTKTPYIAD